MKLQNKKLKTLDFRSSTSEVLVELILVVDVVLNEESPPDSGDLKESRDQSSLEQFLFIEFFIEFFFEFCTLTGLERIFSKLDRTLQSLNRT